MLAPLNATAEGWPLTPTATTARRGLSVARDRWDLRYAVVIEGVARRRTDEVAAVQLWIDWQTQQPLYFISKRDNGLLLDIGILVHRFSSDRAGYPDWPGGGRAHVFDPVAAVVLLRAEPAAAAGAASPTTCARSRPTRRRCASTPRRTR